MLGERTLVMGILNVTPDSFADGGAYPMPDAAVAAGLRMVANGASLLDIGGESTRPGASPLPAAEEWRRVEPVLSALASQVRVPLSIDTYKAEVASRALERGATIVNDVSAFQLDPELASVVAAQGAAVVLMHNRGRSTDMYARAQYADVVTEVEQELRERVAAAERAGIPAERILVDPGLGFAKRAEHSLAVLAGLERLAAIGRPLVVGPSRKSFLTAALGDVPPHERVWGTGAAVAASVMLGAHIVRVHDVAEMGQIVRVIDAIR